MRLELVRFYFSPYESGDEQRAGFSVAPVDGGPASPIFSQKDSDIALELLTSTVIEDDLD